MCQVPNLIADAVPTSTAMCLLPVILPFLAQGPRLHHLRSKIRSNVNEGTNVQN